MEAEPASRDLSAVEIAKLEGRMSQGFTELNGKLDTLIAKQEAAEVRRDDDRTTSNTRHTDHENRIRALEAKSTVSPKGMWTALVGAAAVVAAAISVVQALAG